MAVDLRQTHFRWGRDELTQSTHGWYGNEDANVNFIPGEIVRLLRFTEQESGGTAIANVDAQFQYRRYTGGSWGSWTDITTSSSVVKAVPAVAFADGANCTKRLSGTGTFESSAAGCTEDGTSGGTTNDIAASGNSETECALQIIAADVLDGDILEFRITSPDTTIGYDVTPSVIVIKSIHEYTTTFPLTEDPISEGGNWICGSAGLDWYDIKTTGGNAIGEASPESYSDPCAILTGIWGPNQSVEATVYANSPSKTQLCEVELRLRNTIAAHSLTGYEVALTPWTDSDYYLGIGRWNGPRGDIDHLGDAVVGVEDGDVLRAEIIGSRISVYVNDVLVKTLLDDTYTSGNPGIGMNYDCGSEYANFGFKDFTARDNIVGGVIAVGADDVQFGYDGGWSIYTTQDPVYFGHYNGQPDLGAFRFTIDAAIPSGATIDTTPGATTVTFYAQGDHAVDEAYLYVTESADAPQLTAIGNRPTWADSGGTVTYPTTLQGSGVVHWTGTWPSVAGTAVLIDVGPLIQHLVDTYGGLAGGAQIVIWIDGPGTGNVESSMFSYEQSTEGLQAELRITYAVGGAYSLSCAAGSYALTGTAATTKRDGKLDIGAGSYALTGQAAGAYYGRAIDADAGGYAVTGAAASVLRTAKIIPDAGAYNLTGQDAALLRGMKLAIDAGAYVLTGADVALLYGRAIDADAGAYVVTGQAAALLRAALLAAEAGAYVLTGADVATLFGRKLTAEAGACVLTGQDVTLVYVPGGGAYVLTADGGAYALTGQAVGLLKASKLTADAGAYAITGEAASTLLGRLLAAGAGVYDISGVSQDFYRAARIYAESGSLLLTGRDVAFLPAAGGMAFEPPWPAGIVELEPGWPAGSVALEPAWPAGSVELEPPWDD